MLMDGYSWALGKDGGDLWNEKRYILFLIYYYFNVTNYINYDN